MISALVDAAGTVVNMIVADPSSDRAPDGHSLQAIPMSTDLLGASVLMPVQTGWTWSTSQGFLMPDGSAYVAPTAVTTPPDVL